MNPGTILPHPDAPDAYVIMRAPPAMANCVDLAYRFVTTEDNGIAMMAEFIPDAREIELLQAGHPLRFMFRPIIDQNGHPLVPPISLWAREEGEV